MVLIRIFLYMLFGLVLSCGGVTVRTWQYWAAMVILMAVDCLSCCMGDRKNE